MTVVAHTPQPGSLAAVGGVPGRAERFPALEPDRERSRERWYSPVRSGGLEGTLPDWPLLLGVGGGGGRGQLVAVWPPGASHDCTGVHGAVQARVVG